MLSQPKSACAPAGRQFISVGSNSIRIVNLNSAFEKVDRLFEQKHTGSQYDKNEQLVAECGGGINNTTEQKGGQ
jgi:hypothetical protein